MTSKSTVKKPSPPKLASSPEVPPASSLEAPLAVDLDGTLVQTDVLLEAVFLLLKENVLNFFLLFAWLFKGKAYFKQQIADRVNIDASLLPYNAPLLKFLQEEKSRNRTLILATATNIKFAKQIAKHLGLFDHVLASDGQINLSGKNKLAHIKSISGNAGFDYAGNAKVDLAIWSEARKIFLVNPELGVHRAAQKIKDVERVFNGSNLGIRPYLKAIRIHQWVKNLLVFVPLVTAHKIESFVSVFHSALAFLAFSLCASSVYLLNDLFDLPADRKHPSKKNRPFAAGTLPVGLGVKLMVVLFLASLAIALALPIEFLAALIVYHIFTTSYSLRLKKTLLLDVMVLAGLYTLRIIGGAAAVPVHLSFWLLAFSMFFFLSLALVKRYSELLVMEKEGKDEVQGRRYIPMDRESLAQMGCSSGYLSVLVFAFYIQSEHVSTLYKYPEALWLLAPLMLYWISRVWILTRRDALHEDPVVFALQDRTSHWLVVIGLIILWVAT